MAQNDTLIKGWQPVIGLEVHVQLMTNTKLFSPAKNQFGEDANTLVDLIDLGLPGVLPVLNEGAMKQGIKFGLATNAKIAETMIFDRKNYFYPDLPKGYQITQLHYPIVRDGVVEVNGKKIRIHQAHLEEDAGKSMHDKYDDKSVIDLNRSGVPLLEIVSEPDIRSASEAVNYLKKIHQIITYLDISDGNMSQGSMRCDANVSIMKPEDKEFGIRAEIKNINSFKFVEKAINFEIKRQIKILEANGTVEQETRLYDSVKDETRSMRTKEFANDYRYFPCPDLVPTNITAGLIESVKEDMDELPEEKQDRFMSSYNLNEYDAGVICADKKTANFFEEVVKNADVQLAAKWIIGDLNALLNKHDMNLEESKIDAQNFSELIQKITDNTISGKIAKEVLEEMWNTGIKVSEVIDSKGMQQISDEGELENIIEIILSENTDQVNAYKSGKDKLFGFFVGQVMKATQGKANPGLVNELLKKKLS
ncbi:Asp-tRNA(Asn)/Glu-tRNA(Gln) amidotransferase subunit GatB [Gammaproteobacteria bacterium]|nr:Asp-tRNA(Asn)/Glu-tRNA(Gln) amidotransferase subunit GatB [Gammaproteobacteria bacterium]